MRTVPDLLTFSLATPETLLHLAPSDDGNFSTHTSREQYITEKSILQLLQSYGPPTGIPLRELTLHRQKHIDWLLIGLERLSAGFTTLDASRPWIVYWIVNSLDLLGFEFPDGLIDRYMHHVLSPNVITAKMPNSTRRIIETLARFQCPTGGFCGGPGQLPHLATTYASVNVLAILATPKAYRIIDRDSMFSFFLSLKQADGSFIMHEGGEIDVRGSYCVLSVAYMLDLLTPRLTDGISDFILKCQSYEGGFSGSPGVEAHGGYSFCAVAALEILGKVPQCNLDGLVRWSASRHMKVEGGFSGRANKLVDGCYSFWCGSLYPIIEKNLRALGRVQGDSTIDLMNRGMLFPTFETS